MKKYRSYFDIDEDYFPQVTEDLINKGKVDWRKFYPHSTFVKLLVNMISVLTRQQKLSVWVEGAYGTGKSHAVLTLKKLLDATEKEMKEYFERYSLSMDLYNKFKSVKSQGEILTVHRYGSSSIYSDRDLILAIQESITNELIKRNIQNKGEVALKNAVITWLSDEAHKKFFDDLIKGRYESSFAGDTVDSIIEKLNNSSENSVISLMNKIFHVADEEGISALKLDIPGLISWIRSVISENNLKAIVFIWDEFTEYFMHNRNALTGFQALAEVSATDPFYLTIVTHKSSALFNDTDADKKKILNRFIEPTCKIELPENMAFQLIGAAMEKTKDSVLLAEWNEAADDLNDRLKESRTLVKNSAHITDKELIDILPIHPYTALLLKHISSAFNSNQRSMFDFIKNDRGEDVKGFQWFIDNYGPEDDDPLLTIDMLWDFFYEKGKEYLSPDIRTILDTYARQNVSKLSIEEKKVLKTILMLQAISQKVGDSVELFIPNDKNVNNAYDGSDLENGAAEHIAEKLVRDEILFKKPMGQGKFEYSAMINAGDSAAIGKYKEELSKQTTTMSLVNTGEVLDLFALPGALKLRYVLKAATVDNFKNTINMLRNQEASFENKILVVVTFAKNDEESVALSKAIKDAVQDDTYKMYFVDASLTPFGKDGFEQYIENLANSSYHRNKDNSLATQYENLSKEILKKWKERILAGEFMVYSHDKPLGERIVNNDLLVEHFTKIDIDLYNLGLEQYHVIDNMFMASSLKKGVECGATMTVAGTFRSSNPNTKLEKIIEEAGEKEEYWKDVEVKNRQIVKIKIAIEELIQKAFEEDGKVSITAIYNMLKQPPYGFMPCNLTAFVMGFLLKEYACDKYQWSDGLNSDNMSVLKLKEMIEEVIKLQLTPNLHYRDKYIVTMTEEARLFVSATSQIFDIPANQCVSVEQTRLRICNKMKELGFPIWCLKSIKDTVAMTTTSVVIDTLIDDYLGLANNNNIAGNRSESDFALEIGKLCIDNPDAAKDLALLVTRDNCQNGMRKYISQFNGGELVSLSEKINDHGAYIMVVKQKFDADEANWVWGIDTAEQKIRETILEYQIIERSNEINSKVDNFAAAIHTWCEKIGYIKVSYAAIKSYVDDVQPLLDMLVQIKTASTILDSQKNRFLELLNTQLDLFVQFYKNQVDYFKKACSFELDELSDEEISEVFNKVSYGMFTKDKSEYLNTIGTVVAEYKENQGKMKLKNLWKDKTGTSTPREWSNRYKMPVLCMVPQDEVPKAKEAFDAVQRNTVDKATVDRALDYLQEATFYDKLVNEEERDYSFRKYIIKGYDIMLPNVQEVKEYLNNKVSAEPYDWYQSADVDTKLTTLAEHEYSIKGSTQALALIDQMDEVHLKDYLKRLIKDNMLVGIEIIKDKQ